MSIRRQPSKWTKSQQIISHDAGIRPRRYSRTAAVPLASIATRGSLNELPSSCSVLPKQQQQLFCSHYTGQPALAGTSSQESEDFAGAKTCCQHATVVGN